MDFLKLDVEGAEYNVLLGSANQLNKNTLGLRCEVHFLPALLDQKLFPDVHKSSVNNGFFILNLDYFGRGNPRNMVYKNPDPRSLDYDRCGVLSATDGGWLLSYNSILESAKNDAQYLSRWRIVPDNTWEKAQYLFKTIFEKDLIGGSEYYEFICSL